MSRGDLVEVTGGPYVGRLGVVDRASNMFVRIVLAPLPDSRQRGGAIVLEPSALLLIARNGSGMGA